MKTNTLVKSYDKFIMISNEPKLIQNNFAKYTFDEVSIGDVPYDYESVMHYSGTGFVNTPGGTSINPKIPYFANIIGQRKDFRTRFKFKLIRVGTWPRKPSGPRPIGRERVL